MKHNNWRSADPIPRSELIARINGSAGAVLGRLAKTLRAKGRTMSYLYRGVSQAMDTLCGGKLRPKGNSAKVAMKIGDPSLRIDGTWDIGASEENAVRAHQFESGRHGGCLVSTTRNEKMAQLFATTGNTEDGYVYVIDESLLPAYGVLAFERKYQENSHEEEVSLRAEDCGDLPEEIIVAKYEVHAST